MKKIKKFDSYEILPFKFKQRKLKEELLYLLQNEDPVIQESDIGYKGFGGWSLQSANRKHTDGWDIQGDFTFEKDGKMTTVKRPKQYHPNLYTKRTNACTGYFNEVLDTIESKGFFIRRARITFVEKGVHSVVHRDAPDNVYMARIHIPIITNEDVWHQIGKNKFNMPANGSAYMIWVNNIHQFGNDSQSKRYHIIMDAYDVKGVTQHFKYQY